MLTTTHLARELFEQAGADRDATTTDLHPHRAICVPVIMEFDGVELSGHTIAVSPDTIDLDSHDALEAGDRIAIRRADDDSAGYPAVVMHCTGTIIGYTIGIAMQ